MMTNEKLQQLREKLSIAVHAALQDFLQMPLHFKVLSSEIRKEELQPEGTLFDVHFRVQVLPKKDTPK